MIIARARLALSQAAQNHLIDPNVSMIDFGYPEQDGQLCMDELAIRIHVHKKLRGAALENAVDRGFTRRIPESYGGFPTDVPQSTPHLHQGWFWSWQTRPADPRRRRQKPLRGGISISNQYQRSSGTLGTMVIDRRTRNPMLLSNWHVLVGRWGANQGERIYQPGRLDGGSHPDTVGHLSRDSMSKNLDAAVAALDGSRPLINDQFQLGSITGVKPAELGMQVIKSGRSTGITHGIVAAIEGITRLRYDSLYRIIHHVITIEPLNTTGTVSGPGDSGSIWLEESTHTAVGLHFAGSDLPERALAMELQPVLDALDVVLE